MSATCSLSNGFSPVQLLLKNDKKIILRKLNLPYLGLTITDSVLISLGPNLVPGLLDVAVSRGTPTIQASRPFVSARELIGSLMNEAIPAGRGRSFWWIGLLFEDDTTLHRN